MSAKYLGRAEFDLEEGLWVLEGTAERFSMNLRLVETRPEVKKARSVYSKSASRKPPPKGRPAEREAHFEARDEAKRVLNGRLAAAWEEIKQDSFSAPVPLYKHRDYAHKIDWRYGLYRGAIYRFDRAGYSSEEMRGRIEGREQRAAGRLPPGLTRFH